MAKFIFYLLTLNIINFLSIDLFINCDTLSGLYFIHRHGDRSLNQDYGPKLCPSLHYLTNLKNAKEIGIGHLTITGKQRMFEIGKFIGSKYNKFLGDNKRDIKIRSIDLDRILESSQLLLNGVYSFNQQKSDKKHFNPIPIHTIPEEYDSMLYQYSECPNAEIELNNILNKNVDIQLNQQYHQLYQYLSEKCKSEISDHNQINHIRDILINEFNFDLELPNWITLDIWEQMSEFWSKRRQLMLSSKKLKRLRTGLLFNEILQTMEKIILKKNNKSNSNNLDTKKAYFYSGNDVLLFNLLAALKFIPTYNNSPVHYGSVIIFELHYHDNLINQSLNWEEISSIKIFYHNETNKNESYEFKIASCLNTRICTIKQFKESIEDLILNQEEWNKECELNDNDLIIEKMNKDLILVIFILVIFIINLIIIMLNSRYDFYQ